MTILELCEDIILLNPAFAIKAKIEELLWSHGFYLRFEELKQDIKKYKSDASYQKKLLDELSFGTSFYQLLLLSLSNYYDQSIIVIDKPLL